MKQIIDVKRKSELILILWAGSAALLSYSLVYALRKPYTAASFEGLSLMGIDYKVAVTTIQILGYVIAKFFGIKIISELKKENRFRFFVGSAVLAEISLLLFGMFEAPFNAFAMFLNGLSLGCMWGIIFSFIEGRKITDILASLLGVSMVFSSGLSKSVGLFVINDLGIDQFWMPAIMSCQICRARAKAGASTVCTSDCTTEHTPLNSVAKPCSAAGTMPCTMGANAWEKLSITSGTKVCTSHCAMGTSVPCQSVPAVREISAQAPCAAVQMACQAALHT